MNGAVIAILVILALAELGLLLWGLIDLVRRPATSLMPKWAWVIVMLVFNFFGPIVYLIAGRQAVAAAVDPLDSQRSGAAAAENPSEHAVDVLYGPDDQK